MNTAMIHCYYNQYGGEDAAADAERELIKPTLFFGFKNAPGIKGLIQFLFSIYNIRAANKICKELEAKNIKLVHIHNWHFAVGPYIIRALKKRKIKVVVTLHNFRILCPGAILYHNGKIIQKNRTNGFPWYAVRQRIYRNSFLLSFWLGFINWFHLKIGTFKKVDVFQVHSDFAKKIYVNSSLNFNPDQFKIKPNSGKDPGVTFTKREDHFLFVGRLSEEKGIRVMIESILKSGAKLKIIGDGPLRSFVEDHCKTNPNIEYLGFRNRQFILQELGKCSALLFPSVCYEGMPLSIIEAFASGTPVIASELGAMQSMIKNEFNGLHFHPGNSLDLGIKIRKWNIFRTEEKEQYSLNARRTYEQTYTPENNLKQIISIYQSIIHEKERSAYAIHKHGSLC